MNYKFIKYKFQADTIGMISGVLCLLHCVAIPFIFIVQAYGNNYSTKLAWWGTLEYVFLIISFFAIFFKVKNSSKKWIKSALWLSWSILTFTILDETFQIELLPEWFIYFTSFLLVGLHLYNRKYCSCNNKDKCCVM